MKKEKLKDICAYLLTVLALFLCGYAVMQIIQKILCSILQVVLFFAAVALGG